MQRLNAGISGARGETRKGESSARYFRSAYVEAYEASRVHNEARVAPCRRATAVGGRLWVRTTEAAPERSRCVTTFT